MPGSTSSVAIRIPVHDYFQCLHHYTNPLGGNVEARGRLGCRAIELGASWARSSPRRPSSTAKPDGGYLGRWLEDSGKAASLSHPGRPEKVLGGIIDVTFLSWSSNLIEGGTRAHWGPTVVSRAEATGGLR